MKLVCTSSDLSTHLSLVSRAVPSRPTHPVLGNVLLTADTETSTVRLTAFDLSLGIQTSFSANIELSGEITLPAKLFNDIVSRLPEGEIALEEVADGQGGDSAIAVLTSSSGRYQVRGISAEEFPELPEVTIEGAIHLPAEVLVQGLRSTLFATSSDETKQVLTGVHLTLGSDSLEFAATDGHRLAVVQTSNQGEEEDQQPITIDTPLQFTIPARALRELERMLASRPAGSMVALQFEEGQIVFQAEGDRLTSRTLEGQYPAYRQLIPNQFQRQVTIDRRQLLSAVERIAVLADQKNNIIKFTIDNDNQQLSLSVDAQDVGSGRESLSAQITGESLEVAFNVKYLLDGLKALPTSDIQMQLNTGSSPVILIPLGGVKMTYLVMPVQIRS
jgi:DNA polymerase-3 subunit beta